MQMVSLCPPTHDGGRPAMQEAQVRQDMLMIHEIALSIESYLNHALQHVIIGHSLKVFQNVGDQLIHGCQLVRLVAQ